MNTSRTWAVALSGIEGHLVEVEADVSSQTPEFRIIGLADKALGEAVQRVVNACGNSSLELPRRRLTVNLTPASLPKFGSGFDVAIAIAALTTAGLLDPVSVANTAHVGELGLDGRVRPVAGVLPAVFAAARAGIRQVVVPAGNEQEARLVTGIRVIAVASLAEAARLHGAVVDDALAPAILPNPVPEARVDAPELADIAGQEEAVNALIIAAAGGHHLLLGGPPGAGKTMLARRLPAILPQLDESQALEVATIRSLNQETIFQLDRTPPFEAPHHNATVAALIGGGSRSVRPGAIVRAHRGVLFLDEVAEFPRSVLDALRQPLESGAIDIYRAGFVAHFPARFQLVMAMNPCPCGNSGSMLTECVCPPATVRRYAGRLSGPLRDRIDIDLQINRISAGELSSGISGRTTTAAARQIVTRAREHAAARWAQTPWKANAEVPGAILRSTKWRLGSAVRSPLDRALERGAISLRGYDRTLRVAWSISDIAGLNQPDKASVGRALFLRRGVIP